ncbi:MAG TPA: OB-fold domain-containing protein [Anaerolineae bacterium]|nr:OB-fold domain-containing protein [Anaerolineae bacterium]
MIGITAYGTYVPVYRLGRNEIARAWKTSDLGGERTVARHDEDSLTMAVSATLQCMNRIPKAVDGLFFASTTPPYREKQSATIVAAATDLPMSSRTVDITDSLRAGTIAMGLAADAVKSGTHDEVIVVASDCRMGAGKSEFEQMLGDGAAAVAIGKSEVIASIDGSLSAFSELIDVWRREGSAFTQAWERRFITSEGYTRTMQQVISGIMTEYNLSPEDFSKVIYNGPDRRSHASLARSLGFDLENQVQDPMYHSVGNVGTAAVLMMLAFALDAASPGDTILVANYGDGADAHILGVTEDIRLRQGQRRTTASLERKIPINYETYLSWRDLVPVEVPSHPEPRAPSIPCLWRERRSILAFYGNKCQVCGAIQYPPQRVCTKCQAKDRVEDYKLSDKRGHVFTYAIDQLSWGKEAPVVVGVVDFEGGGRVMCEICDCDPDEISIGMPVETCFRKCGQNSEIHNYAWKVRPAS